MEQDLEAVVKEFVTLDCNAQRDLWNSLGVDERMYVYYVLVEMGYWE